MSEADDKLILRSRAGDDGAFQELVRRYQDRLVHSLEYSFGSRDDALEVSQQAFLQAWRGLDSFRGQSGFYSWLYRIAMNVAVSRHRKQRVSASSLDKLQDAGTNVASDEATTDPTRPAETDDDIAMVQRALSEIAETFRQPLVMKEMDGLSYEDIAGILKIPIGTVRSRIFRARRELADKLRHWMQ